MGNLPISIKERGTKMKLLLILTLSFVVAYCLYGMRNEKAQYQWAETAYYDYEDLNSILDRHYTRYRDYKIALMAAVILLSVIIVLV